ncbi:MAG: C4-type zinc ribbon domain-containing protein [Candidatus Neomarinimicrobiota bacterium]
MSELSQLLQLQEVDSKLIELEHLKGDLPRKVEELTSRIEELTLSTKVNEKRLKEITVEIRRIQGEETDRKGKIEKLKDQLYLVKTNREYDALMSEIDHLKGEVDEEELRELELSEENERLEEQVKLDRLETGHMEQELRLRKKELAETISKTERQYKKLMLEREALTPKIDARYMGLYDRVRGAREGVAVVPIVDHACGGCHSRVTSQSLVEIRHGHTIVQCPVCRRILYWRED